MNEANKEPAGVKQFPPGTFIKGYAENRRVYLVDRTGREISELDCGRSRALRNHSPDGFCWGHAGSGPAQLALAVLLEFVDDERTALRLYQGFKFEVVAKLEMGRDFLIAAATVSHWLNERLGAAA